MDGIRVETVCLWICAATSFVYAQNYVNVAVGKTYDQSNRYILPSHPSAGSSAMAANGDTSGYYPTNCIHTFGSGDWWEVDLGRTYPVYNLTVWGRTKFQHRLYPFNITVDGQTCASVTSFPVREMNVTCSSVMYGRKVRITRHPTPQQTGDDRTLNMCELQIWVCVDGLYGDQCSKTCSPGCQNTVCDRLSGQCSPCTPGYTGDRCSECVSGLYGEQCSTACSPGCQNAACDQDSGHCSPCIPGYAGDSCARCVSGLHGDQCSTTCSPGCQNGVCQQSGHCAPCNAGYTEVTCEECQDTYYKTSSGTCVQCGCNCQSRSCDKETGKCNGCVAGWYGDQCSIACSSGCQDSTCGQQTGLCSSCKPGYTGNTCTDKNMSKQLTTCKEDKDSDKIFSNPPFIGSVIGAGLAGFVVGIITICVIMSVRRSRRSHENTNATNELGSSTSPTPANPTAPADREQAAAAFQGVPDQEGQYERVGDIPMTTKHVHPGTSAYPDTTTTHIHPGTSTHPDTTSHVTEADNPYDLPTEQYSNTGEVHLYDPWRASSP